MNIYYHLEGDISLDPATLDKPNASAWESSLDFYSFVSALEIARDIHTDEQKALESIATELNWSIN